MSSTTLFEMPFSEFQLKNAVSSALQQSLNYPTQFSIESNLEAAVRDTIQNSLGNIRTSEQCPTCPYPNGSFRTAFNLNLLVRVNYKFQLDFKLTAGAGLQYNLGNFTTDQSVHISLYNSELVYANRKRGKTKPVIDATVTVMAIVGGGEALPTRLYSINQDTFSPLPNNYAYSIGFAQAFTWNSIVNERISFRDIQRQGILNVRMGGFYLSTSNDSRYYGGGNTDFGNTGEIILGFNLGRLGIFELAHQTFTGRYDEKGEREKKKEEIEARMRAIKKDNTLSPDEKKAKLAEEDCKLLTFLWKEQNHTQHNNQDNLNKAFNSFNIIRDNKQFRLDIETTPFMQKFLHQGDNPFGLDANGVRDLKFNDYEIKNQKKYPIPSIQFFWNPDNNNNIFKF